jgi:hypothetical protein
MLDVLQRVFWAQFPDWARPTNAVYRYVRQQQHIQHGWLWRWIRWAGSLAILAGLVKETMPDPMDCPQTSIMCCIFCRGRRCCGRDFRRTAARYVGSV